MLNIETLPLGVITTVIQHIFLRVRVRRELISTRTSNCKIEGKKEQNDRHSNKSKRKKIPPTAFESIQ